MADRVYLNANEASEILGVTPSCVYWYVKNGVMAAPIKRKRKHSARRINHWHRDDVLAVKEQVQSPEPQDAEIMENDDAFWKYILFISGVVVGAAIVPILEFLS